MKNFRFIGSRWGVLSGTMISTAYFAGCQSQDAGMPAVLEASEVYAAHADIGEDKAKEFAVLESRVKDLNYRGKNNFPSQIQTRYSVGKSETQVTYTVLAIAQSAFEYALYGCLANSNNHLIVAKNIIKEAAEKNLIIEGENASLVSSWFVSQTTRAILHLEKCAPKLASEIKSQATSWIRKSHLTKIKDQCTKDFVRSGPGCRDHGSTNRTFALLEAEILFYVVESNQSEIQRLLKNDGEYTRYIRNYFENYDSCEEGQCRTKDFDREDAKHPAMGFQSIFKIEKIRKEKIKGAEFEYHKKLKFGAEEAAKLESQYHGATEKTSCYTGGPWESAPLVLGFIGQAFFQAQNLIRINSEGCKKPYHAWGYDLLTKSY